MLRICLHPRAPRSEPPRLKPYYAEAVRKRATNFLRDRRKFRDALPVEDLARLPCPMKLRTDPLGEDAIASREWADLVRRAVFELSPELRTVIELRYFEEKSFDEIRQQIGRAIGTAHNRHDRAIERLRGVLEEHCPED